MQAGYLHSRATWTLDRWNACLRLSGPRGTLDYYIDHSPSVWIDAMVQPAVNKNYDFVEPMNEANMQRILRDFDRFRVSLLRTFGYHLNQLICCAL